MLMLSCGSIGVGVRMHLPALLGRHLEGAARVFLDRLHEVLRLHMEGGVADEVCGYFDDPAGQDLDV